MIKSSKPVPPTTPQSSYTDIWSLQSAASSPQLNRQSQPFVPRMQSSSTIGHTSVNEDNEQQRIQQYSSPPLLPHTTMSYSSPSEQLPQQHSTGQYGIHSDMAGTPQNVNDITGLKLPLFEAKYYINEHITHLYNMFNYRVRLCEQYAQTGVCMYDTATCFDAHSYDMIRRIPRILAYSNGHFFSYNACRCQQYELEGQCDKGSDCRYSHCKDEIGMYTCGVL
jgi:hypothetical protein